VAGDGDTREHLANVRTLLAWVRTSVTIMAFGFVVARFGLLINALPGRHHPFGGRLSSGLGTSLVLLGALFLVLSTAQYLATRRGIEEGRVVFRPGLYLMLSGALVVVAIVLAVYLLLTS